MKRFAAVIALLAGIAAVPAARPSAPATKLTIFAAASVTDAFRSVGAAFTRDNPGTELTFNFAGSQQLAAQLELGARADVFASADERWMSYARERSLIDGEPAVFTHNWLVVIYPRSNPARIQRLADLARPGVKLVLAADAVPAGHYSRDMLRNLGQAEANTGTFTTRVLANVVSNEETVKGVVTRVQLGEADAGVVYRSDVTSEVARFVSVLEIPRQQNVMASYPIAVLKGSAVPVLARRFVDFLRSTSGQQILSRYGFEPIQTRP